MQITLDDITITVTHRCNRRIKNISLLFETKEELIIRTPLGIKPQQIRDIALRHKSWILSTINKVQPKNRFDFVYGGVVPYLGNELTIVLVKDNLVKLPKFVLCHDKFIIHHNDNNSYEDFMAGLEYFYKINASKIILPLFDKWTKTTQLYPKKIGFRKAKRRWGSCSSINNISMNYKLLQFSQDVIEYVVLHELCHIKEKNHSKRFWNLLSRYMPLFKQKEQVLKLARV